jgi:hypothetical protein
MPTGLHQISEDRNLAELPARLEPMQALNQDKTLTVAPQQDRRLQTVLQNAFREFVDNSGIERSATRHRHVDLCHWKRLASHDGNALALKARGPRRLPCSAGALSESLLLVRFKFLSRVRQKTFALGLFAGQLAHTADGFVLLPVSPLGRLLVKSPLLHFAEDSFALHFLLQVPKRLVDVVVAYENLQRIFLLSI